MTQPSNDAHLANYWDDLPVGRESAYTYDQLCMIWQVSKREVRKILHALSCYDNGDDMILIRSSNRAGFYKTNNPDDISAYRRECLNRGRRTLVPLRKIDRVLAPDFGQMTMTNNLKSARVAAGLSAAEVCFAMAQTFPGFDTPLLSRMENDRCLPTPGQLAELAQIYGCTPRDLLNMDLYQTAN